MNRWSLTKPSLSRNLRTLFASQSALRPDVTAADFRTAVEDLRDAMRRACLSDVAVEITLYDALKQSISKWEPDLQEALNEQNDSHIFTTLSEPQGLSEGLWDQAVYIEAHLRPLGGLHPEAFALIESKGTDAKTMTFYVQPEEIGARVKEQSVGRFQTWKTGNGWRSHHIVTLG